MLYMTEKELNDRKNKIANLTEEQKERRNKLFTEWMEKVRQIQDITWERTGKIFDGGIGSNIEYRKLEEYYLTKIHEIENEKNE